MTRRGNFAIWITGLPASGKSTVTAALVPLLKAAGVVPAVLESDRLRTILTPAPTYSSEERDRFYLQMTLIGAMLFDAGIPVIFDATANRRTYREYARSVITRFLEVYIECPLETCAARDPKGIYAAARRLSTVPGLHVPYEPPISPDIVLHCGQDPGTAARTVIEKLKELEYL